MSKPTLEEIQKMIEQTWNNLAEDYHIDIQEGWFGKEDDKYWGFSARFPGSNMMLTGLGGFLKFWNKDIPVKYNGVMLPVEEYDKFYNYCKNDLSHEEEE